MTNFRFPRVFSGWLAIACVLVGTSMLSAAEKRPQALSVRAENCRITPVFGHYRKVESSKGKLIQLASDSHGNPAHAMGDFQIHFPQPIPDGTYRLTICWRTGRMNGTPWAFVLGADGGNVVENGIEQSGWHYFYPGLATADNDRWFTHDLAGPQPIGFSMFPNTPVAGSITVSGVGKNDFYVRVRDMSPGRNNTFGIESLTLTPISPRGLRPAKPIRPGSMNIQHPVESKFTIGVYYAMPWLNPKDDFSWDYAFMDMARSGCNFVVISGNCGADQWAAIKHWGMRGVTSYGQLNGYPGPGKWKPSDFSKGIKEQREFLRTCIWKDEHVGDACVGHLMTDEPECPPGLSEDKRRFLRAWADAYHRHNPNRKVYVNHCDPKWYDLNEKHATCSAAPTIAVNSQRISDRIRASRAIGLKNFTVVALLGRMSDWGGGKVGNVEYWNIRPATPAVFGWLAKRTNAQDAYEEMVTAFCYGASGFHPYMYNQHRAVSLVDRHGNGQYGIRRGFSTAAHDLRRSHGWPSVTLANNGSPFADRGTYSAGEFTLTAQAVSDSGKISKVVFGKSTDGGGVWQTRVDATAPYSAKFSAEPGKTVIFRARAIAEDGKQSIYAANMIQTQAMSAKK